MFLIFGFLGLCLGLDFLFKFWFVLPLLGFRVFFFFFFFSVIGFLGLFHYWVFGFFFSVNFVLSLLIFYFYSSVIYGFVLSSYEKHVPTSLL